MLIPMETVPCPLCGSYECEQCFTGQDRFHGVPGSYPVVRCRRCGMRYLSPRPDAAALAQFYPPDYLDADWSAAPPFIAAQVRDELARRRALVEASHVPGDLLDVGAGSGDFLATMREREGWRVHGLEPSPHARARAAARHGLTLDAGTLDGAPCADGSFDAVTMWEVLEHTPNPVAALRRARAPLRPGGALVLSTPNADSLASRAFGVSWCGWDVPRHLAIFAPGHLRRALESVGFADVRIGTPRGPLGATNQEFAAALLSLGMALHAAPGSRRARLGRAVASTTGRPAALVALFLLTWPLSVGVRALGRGTQMVAMARRL